MSKEEQRGNAITAIFYVGSLVGNISFHILTRTDMTQQGPHVSEMSEGGLNSVKL